MTLKLQKETSHFQEDDFAYRKIFKQYVYHAVHYCENYQEFSQVMKCTHDFIASTPLSDHKKEILCNFVTNIDEKSSFISYYNRQHARTLGTHTDGQNESENKELKQFQINPRTKLSSIYHADSVRQSIRTFASQKRDKFVQHTAPMMDMEKKKNILVDTIDTLNQLNDYACH